MSERDAETFAVQQLKAMEQPNWSEGRLDDLNRKVDAGIDRLDEERKEFRGEMRTGFSKVDDEFRAVRREMREGFAKVDDEFRSVRGEMKEGFAKVDERFDKVDDEFKAVRSEIKSGFDRMYWALLVGAFGIIAALLTAPNL